MLNVMEMMSLNVVVNRKCNYTYISNTITSYIKQETEEGAVEECPQLETAVVGVYKDDDAKYSIQNLLKRQGESNQA